jgi:hypothetical protein
MTPKEKRQLTPAAAVDRLEEAYAESCAALTRALDRYLSRRSRDGAFGFFRRPACREAFGTRVSTR